MKKIHAGCFQFDVAWGDIDGNAAVVRRFLLSLDGRGCDLLVLPEMWSCGFHYPTLRDAALRSPGLLEELMKIARETRTVLVGSLPELQDDLVYNTAHVIDSTGRPAGRYRKMHLFTHTGEHLHFAGGREPLVCDTSVGRIGIMVCYDLRFPELARRLALDGAQILCVPALWPLAREEHWSLLLRARAVENQLFVLGCNGTGEAGKVRFAGHSAIVSPWGKVLAGSGDEEAFIQADLDPEEMSDFRSRIRCFEDRLPDVYGIY